MRRNTISGTGVEISLLGLGTVKFGRNQQVKYPKDFKLPSDAEIHHLLDVAQEGGVTYLDTAPAYGSSEERLGKILGERSGNEAWTIGTKVGEEFVDGASVFDFAAPAIGKSVERSLTRLKRESLDLVLLHSDGNDVEILSNTASVPALAALKQAGKVRAIGISTKTVEGGKLAFKLGLDVVMATYNPWYRDEEEVLDVAAELGRLVLIKKALGSGWMGRDTSKTTGEQVEESFRLIFGHPAATSAVVGTVNPKNLQGNAAVIARIQSQPD